MEDKYYKEKKQVADMVKRLRSYAGLSQRMLSKETGITQSDISRIERGIANPSIETIAKIMHATGASLNVDFVIGDKKGEYLVEPWGSVDSKIAKVCQESIAMVKEELKEDLKGAILYGSCARGENTENSDVDIALLTESNQVAAKKYTDSLATIASVMMEKYSELVNFVCLPIADFNAKKEWYPYYRNIDKEGIVFYR